MYKGFYDPYRVGVIGLLIRNWIDEKSRKKEEREVANRQALEFKLTIIDEYVDLYSAFYSVRKLYHSTLNADNCVLDEVDRKKLKIDSFKSSTKHAGKYGTLKVRIINHYKLPKDDWDAKEINQLESDIEESQQPNDVFRIQLDLSGAYYDKWITSIEQGVRIDAEGNQKFYKRYNDILTTLEARKIEKTISL